MDYALYFGLFSGKLRKPFYGLTKESCHQQSFCWQNWVNLSNQFYDLNLFIQSSLLKQQFCLTFIDLIFRERDIGREKEMEKERSRRTK
jgi:hypothetical protein